MTSEIWQVILYMGIAVAGFVAGTIYVKAAKKLKMTDNRRRILRYCMVCGGWPFLLKLLREKKRTGKDAWSIIESRYSELKGEEFTRLIALYYNERTGKRVNLKKPRTFNEKIQWLKAYDSTSLKTQLADKYLARDWVAEKIGSEHLVPQLGVWNKFDDIDFSALPEQFVLKANHGSEWNVIVRNKSEWLSGQNGGGGVNSARSLFNEWLATNYAYIGFELHYKDIKPRIVAEKYIGGLDCSPTDYKFHCFNGKVEYIQMVWGRGSSSTTEAFYDTNWQLQPFVGINPRHNVIEKRPPEIDEMILAAQELCKGFLYVRVDLYYADGKVYFGEMTFTPNNGCGKWDPPETDFMLGEKIVLPSEKAKR